MNVDFEMLGSAIRSIMIGIRMATPKPNRPSWRHASDLTLREDYLKGERVDAASLTLFPSGCRHAARGGCTMCGEWSGSNFGQLVPPDFHVAQFSAAVSDLWARRQIQWLRIYQEGSFFSEREVGPDARRVILRLASHLQGLKRITIESRPEFLTSEAVSAARTDVHPPVDLEIGIGLESSDNFIRNVCIGKGTSLETYEKAVELLLTYDLIPLAYVLLKPPFLTEQEAIEDAIQTVACAFRIGFREVYVQAASIHAWSLSEMLAQKRLYAPPWLWSVIRVVQEANHLGPVKIGGLEYFPKPATIARNYRDPECQTPCGCTERVWHLVEQYNATHNLAVFDGLECDCRAIWQQNTRLPSTSIGVRMPDILSQLSVPEYVAYKTSSGNLSATGDS
jgi:archaeosine synthase beta-subunit